MNWATNLIKEYCQLRDQHKSTVINTTKNYVYRVLRNKKSREQSYYEMAVDEFKFAEKALQLVRSNTDRQKLSDIKLAVSFIEKHISGLEERDKFIIIYSLFIGILVTVYKLLGEDALIVALVLGSSPLIVERIHSNSRTHALKELKQFLEVEVEKRENT